MHDKPPELEMNDVVNVISLSREELKKVGGDKWKIYCGVEGCRHFTTAIDYEGGWTMYCSNVQGGIWIDVTKEFFICGPHNRAYRYRMKELPEKKGPWIDHINKTINHPDFPDNL